VTVVAIDTLSAHPEESGLTAEGAATDYVAKCDAGRSRIPVPQVDEILERSPQILNVPDHVLVVWPPGPSGGRMDEVARQRAGYAQAADANCLSPHRA
jgi:hypothetical protein